MDFFNTRILDSLEAAITLKGEFVILREQRGDFANELTELIDKYRI